MNIMVKRANQNMENMIAIKYLILIAFIVGIIAVIQDNE